LILSVRPRLRSAKRGIITTRNGVEVVESYRREFDADFRAAGLEWTRCAEAIAGLRTLLPEALFLDQQEMRLSPALSGRKIAEHVGRPDKADELAAFLRSNREDVLSEKALGWTNFIEG
jgi:hypothetical protein